MSYDVAKPNFLDWSKKKSEIRPAALPVQSARLGDDDGDADAEPLKLGPKAEYVYKIKLELPAKYTARAPLPFSLKRDYAEYEATYKLEGAVFTAGRTLTLRQDELPAARASDYQAFRRTVGADLGQFLSVENTVAGTPTPPADMKADDLVESGRAAARQQQSARWPFNFSSAPRKWTPRTSMSGTCWPRLTLALAPGR